MESLTTEQINSIQKELMERGITDQSLLEEMIDHICIDLEKEIENGVGFNNAYNDIMKNLSHSDARQLQDDKNFLLNYPTIILKWTLVAFSILMVLALVMRVTHTPGALWITAIATVALGLIMFKSGIALFRDKRFPALNKILAILAILSALAIFARFAAHKMITSDQLFFALQAVGVISISALCFLKYLNDAKHVTESNQKRDFKLLTLISVANLVLITIDILSYFVVIYSDININSILPASVFFGIVVGFNVLALIGIIGFVKNVKFTGLAILQTLVMLLLYIPILVSVIGA